MLRHLDREQVDAVLVEGFRHERYPKIEVYRPSHGRAPQCWPDDPDVVAVASDIPLATDPIPWLDLKDVGAVAMFVVHYLGLHLYDDRPFQPPVPPPSDR
jgi:molybdopterin-guanine dinucleotide biosynthesis protein MobB